MFIASHKLSSRVDFRRFTGAAADPFRSCRLMNHRPASAIMKGWLRAPYKESERNEPCEQRMREAGIEENARDRRRRQKILPQQRERRKKGLCRSVPPAVSSSLLPSHRGRVQQQWRRRVKLAPSRVAASSAPVIHLATGAPPTPPHRRLRGSWMEKHARTDWCRTQRDLLVRER